MFQSNRFARYEDGELVALIAEGLPEFPADVTTLSDAEVGELHDAYAQAAAELLEADEADIDLEAAAELAEHIGALRTEAARRLADASAEPEPTPAPEPTVTDEDRAAQLAALRDTLGEPAPSFTAEPAPAEPGQVPVIDATALGQAIAEANRPLVEAVTAATEAVRVPAVPRRITAAELGQYAPSDLAPPAGDREPVRPRGRLVSRDSATGVPMGEAFTSMSQLTDAMARRHRDIGQSSGTEDEKVVLASFVPDREPPASRDFRGLTASDGAEVRRRVEALVGPDAIGVDPWNLSRELPIRLGGIAVEDPGALVASGGLAAPVEPYYPQLVVAEADRPVLGSMPNVVFERGGIRLVLPPSLGTLTSATTPGAFTDGVATNSSATFTSATAAFTASDIGSPIVETDGGSHIPAGTIISAVGSGTSITLSQAVGSSGGGTGIAFKITNRNPNNLGQPVGVVTAAQDAAGPPQTVKYTYDVPIGTQAEHDVYSIYTSLQFANLTARTFPEQVEANIKLANALAARVADQQALNYITGWSTLLTFAKTFGTARQLLAQFEHMAAYYRNFNRMNPATTLRLLIPAWAMNAMRGDYISTFIGGGDNWGLSDDELNAWFENLHVLPTFYWDGPSDISQLFATVGSGAINTGGVNNATPVAVPDYPGSGSTASFRTEVVSFMWAEGTWLGGTTGEMNLGLVRDSILNSQNRFRNFEEVWETPAFVGLQSLRCVHTVASDGTYGAAASITLGAGSGL